MDIAKILESLREEQYSGSICTADAYIKTIVGESLSSVNQSLLTKELADASARLTYQSPDVELKSLGDSDDDNDWAIMTFTGILTAVGDDRDGDYLESKGMNIDPKMPLLWQHSQNVPIGRRIDTAHHDEKYVAVKYGIVNTDIGRDSVTLVKAGVLRMSHGFKAIDAAPRGTKKLPDGREIVTGWHVKRADVYEGSLVSVPAHPGAEILEHWSKSLDSLRSIYGGGELKSDLVKSWAKPFYDDRPVSVRGHNPLAVKTNDGVSIFNPLRNRWEDDEGREIKCHDLSTPPAAEPDSNKACQITSNIDDGTEDDGEPKPNKSLSDISTKMMGMKSRYLPGSWEYIEEMLEETTIDYLRAKGVSMGDYAWSHAIGTFEGEQVVCLYADMKDSSGRRIRKCYRLDWSDNADGIPEYTGEPQEVEVEATVVEKSLESLVLKKLQSDGIDSIKLLSAAGGAIATKEHTEDEASVLLRHAESIVKYLTPSEPDTSGEEDEFTALLEEISESL